MNAARRSDSSSTAWSTWLSTWTVFYWAWWLSWTPFVGMFIARISRGRTIRQFVSGVLLVPSLVSLVWFCIFGGAAIKLQQTGTDIAGAGGVESQLFTTLQAFPLATRLHAQVGLETLGLLARARLGQGHLVLHTGRVADPCQPSLALLPRHRATFQRLARF